MSNPTRVSHPIYTILLTEDDSQAVGPQHTAIRVAAGDQQIRFRLLGGLAITETGAIGSPSRARGQ